MKTFQPNINEIKRDWHLLDASQFSLGRVATAAAMFLMGKNKATYSPNIENGDNVVIVNAEKVKITGNKINYKKYRSHSGYPKGFKEVSMSKLFSERPDEVIRKAIVGMLPDNRLKKIRLARLTIVSGEKNPYKEKFNLNEKAN